MSCSSLFYCILDPDIHIYNVDSVPNQLSYFEQQLDKILNDFCDVFPSELPHGLPPKRNIDHCIDFLPGVTPKSIPPYRLSRSEEDEVSNQLKEYLRMGYICYSKSPWGAPVLLIKTKAATWHMCIVKNRGEILCSGRETMCVCVCETERERVETQCV